MEDIDEIEEGEACYYKEDEFIDPDIALSYIDEKIQNVLGHFQKDFEGGISAENLGAKYGGYGSFLPTYQRSPSIWCQPKTPQNVQNYSMPRSPNNSSFEVTPQNSRPPLDAVQSLKPETSTTRNLQPLTFEKVLSASASAKPDQCLSSYQANKNLTQNNLPSNKPSNSSDYRNLKVRIIMGSDKAAQSNAAIYSGLGLISPSSSMGNSPEETPNISPTSIVQIMTSSAILGGLILSPLDETLLRLTREETLRPPTLLVENQGDTGSKLEEKVRTKDKALNSVKARLKGSYNMDFDDSATVLSSKGLKSVTMKNVIEDVAEAAPVPNGSTKDIETSFTRNISLEPITGIKGGKYEKSRQRIGESLKDVASSSREDKWCKTDGIRNRLKVENNLFGCNKDLNMGVTCNSQESTDKKEVKTSHGTKKFSFEGKRSSKDTRNSSKIASVAQVSTMLKENKKSDKANNLRASKEIQRVRNEYKDLLQIPDKVVSHKGVQPREKGEASEKEYQKHSNFKKQETKNKKSEAQFSGTDLKNASSDFLTRGELATELATVNPVVIEEDWVCCDKCQKWRLLPYGMKTEHLPEKWLCSMLNWLAGMNRCDISDEVTTNALRALYAAPDPLPGTQINNNSHSASQGTLSANTQNLDRKSQNLTTSHDIRHDGKKKHRLKQMNKSSSTSSGLPISKSMNNFIDDANQPLLQANSPVNSVLIGKHSNNDGKQEKLKSKREGGLCSYDNANPKKFKTNGGDLNRKIDRPDSDGSLPTKATSKNMVKKDELPSSNDARFGKSQKSEISVQKHNVSRVGPLSTGLSEDKTISLKKRKLRDWQDSESQVDMLGDNGKNLFNSMVSTKESSDSELRKLKLSRIEKSNILDNDHGINGKTSFKKVIVMGIGDKAEHNIELMSAEKDQLRRKHKTKVSLKRPSVVGVHSMKNDLGFEQFSLPATSSSSKVSDSSKTRVHFPEAKGSPVESVSSSPLRMSKLGKLSPARRMTAGEDAYGKGNTLMIGSARKPMDGDVNVENVQLSIPRKCNVVGIFNSEPVRSTVIDSKKYNDNAKSGGKCPQVFQNSPVNNTHVLEKPSLSDLKQKSGKVKLKDRDKMSDQSIERLKNSDTIGMKRDISALKSLKDDETVIRLPQSLHEVSNDVRSGTRTIKDNRSIGRDVSSKWPSGKAEILPHHHTDKDEGTQEPYVDSGAENVKQPGFVHQKGDHSTQGHVSSRLVSQVLADQNPLRQDGVSSIANDVLKEAEGLRDYADHLKGSGFVYECNETYFQAALKFLHGASLLETCSSDNNKQGELTLMQIYSNTAKLCEVCVHEYENREEMAAAALVYKCMEVAYMKVVYYKNTSTNRDRHDLQASLQVVPPGESPSSSASDVDNLNNQPALDKAKDMNATYAGNHVIAARNRPSLVRLLDFTKDISRGMEASRKSHNAFAAARVIFEKAQNREGIASVKRVIDFSFQDVEELVRLVRLAIEAISRQGFSASKE
ncbi:cysteine-tryptophan domain-containing zinc finger protein 3-like isoform X2 [Impatiens glandulifera]|uniref:cysteine-tryptophan domain-containing zinc finger protein 3-like isoform X2 n=1 Tax=Impatiens glandulifera TaxID=253017 RepID=UPI001FB19926|nr:cysteine-tryptophan domain-containing zinc finger protein 3-like isoform X2 [Impatiens glandulifera]